jgi:ferredoxin/flavodoxin---NADP+ reductase
MNSFTPAFIKMEKKKAQFSPDLEKVRITGNLEISPGAHLISYHRNHNFIPGQVVRITLSENLPPRIYSICSGNQETEIRILFNIKEEGMLTPRLSACIPGDTILVSKPYGSFTDSGGPAFWIATGTGIAPFYSMFRSGMGEDKRLIHGARLLNQFYFEEELDWALGNRYMRCCSKEQSCDTFPGRVTDYLREENELPRENKYYLCGKALMVVEVRDLLIERGVPFGNILSEIYF